jgi:colanic acid biosynthesis glycosyl transferase WcaI
LYSGDLSFRYGIEEVLAAAERMGDQPDLQWVFIDRGRHCREYRREISDRNLSRVRILPFPSEEDFPRLLASCDIGLVTLERGYGAYSVLSRMFSFMAAARPILAMADSASEVSRIVRQADCGVVVEPGDISGFVAAARRFAADPDRCRTLGLKARRYVQTEFPPEALLRRYDEILRACMESSR